LPEPDWYGSGLACTCAFPYDGVDIEASSAGDRMRRRVALLAGLLWLLPAPASAAPPANDDVDAATVVGALPFSDTVDASEATAATGDLDCSGLEDTHTVWYTITTQTDVVLGLRTTPQFPEHVHTSIATGSPGSLEFLQCSTSDTQTLTAAAGTTYFIQLSSAGDDPGGVVTFGVERVRPVSVFLALRKTGRVDGATVTVAGTLWCSRRLPPGSDVAVQGTLVQGSATGLLVPFHSAVGCPKTRLRWRTTVQVLAGAFAPGAATLTATAFACDEFTCAPSRTKTARIRLR
jgi:hypothetical protein